MSGHSKWHSIRHKKAAVDAKRGAVFSKMVKLISVAAREGGGDPATNFRLRLLIDKAKAANVPKDNIDRAIKRGTGELGGETLDTVLYEGMGPGGAAVLVEAVTDNRNRTFANLKAIFNKHGANMEAKVLWMFTRKGVVRVPDASSVKDRDALELALIEAGAQDIVWGEGALEIVCAIEDLKSVEGTVTQVPLAVDSAESEFVANDAFTIAPEDRQKLEAFLEALDEDDDVSHLYTNAQ